MKTNTAYKFKVYTNRYIYLSYRKSGIYYMVSTFYTHRKYKTQIQHYYYTKKVDADKIASELFNIYSRFAGKEINIDLFDTKITNYEFKEII